MNSTSLRRITFSVALATLVGGIGATLTTLRAEGGGCTSGQSSCGSCPSMGKAKALQISPAPSTGSSTNAPAKR